MANTPETITVTCPNCGQQAKMQKPSKEGIYRITCPNSGCATKYPVRIILPAGNVLIKECSRCGAKIGFKASATGTHATECPKCHTRMSVIINENGITEDTPFVPTKPAILKELKLEEAQLIQLRRLKPNKVFALKEGENTIGRTDMLMASDISIDSDNTMSRQSAVITVERTEKGFQFKLKILKATNIILHNSKPLEIGESVFLNYGDQITLGKTQFRFEKVQTNK